MRLPSPLKSLPKFKILFLYLVSRFICLARMFLLLNCSSGEERGKKNRKGKKFWLFPCLAWLPRRWCCQSVVEPVHRRRATGARRHRAEGVVMGPGAGGQGPVARGRGPGARGRGPGAGVRLHCTAHGASYLTVVF